MSGILDSKTRVIDTVITAEGRRQLARGGIDIQYVTFTDAATFYRADVLSGSQDATQRIYLEACQQPQDEITFRADDDGSVSPFQNGAGVNVAAGRILEYSFAPLTRSMVASPSETAVPLRGDRFASQAEALLTSATDNFKKLYLIATQDRVFDDDKFAAGPSDITYTIHDEKPLHDPATHVTHITSRDSVHSDPRFSDKPNFRYMPPVNKVTDLALNRPTDTSVALKLDLSDFRTLKNFHLAFFKPLGRTQLFKLLYPHVMHELRRYHDQGYSHVISFDPTSSDNQLVGQFFERTGNVLRKLDVIDHGHHNTGNPRAPLARIFFVGKVVVDEKGTDTFVHLFTLVFE